MARPRSICKDERYGKWTVMEFAGLNDARRGTYQCQCDCGTIKVVAGGNLKNGTSKSCGCNSGGVRLLPFQSLYNRFRVDAMRYGREVLISFDEFVSFTHTKECHYCGEEIFWREHGCGITSAYNLDRKHNEPFYSVETVVVCCTRCNRSKSNSFTYDEWMQIGALIRTWAEHDRDVNAAVNTLIVGAGSAHERLERVA